VGPQGQVASRTIKQPAWDGVILPSRGVTEIERAALKMAGIGVREIDELDRTIRSRGGQMVTWGRGIPQLIRANATEMIASTHGRYLFSARAVGRWLIDRGLHEEVQYYVGFGLALGGQGLELPCVRIVIEGYRTRYYDLSCTSMNVAQKTDRLEEIKTFSTEVVLKLIAG
jgi:hypothetical protein